MVHVAKHNPANQEMATVIGNKARGREGRTMSGCRCATHVDSCTASQGFNHSPLQVTIGHGAVIHACTIEDEALVGMGARVLDGAVVRRHAIVAAGALVAPGTEVPSGEVWAGVPARKLRDVDPEEAAFISSSAESYARLAQAHMEENAKVWLVRAAVGRVVAPGST